MNEICGTSTAEVYTSQRSKEKHASMYNAGQRQEPGREGPGRAGGGEGGGHLGLGEGRGDGGGKK